MKEEKRYEWWRLRRNLLVFGKEVRSPIFDKKKKKTNPCCSLFRLCDELSWVRTVLQYLRTPTDSYRLLQHLHLSGTFSNIKTYHFFKVQLCILCKMFSKLAPLRNFHCFFFNKYNDLCLCCQCLCNPHTPPQCILFS